MANQMLVNQMMALVPELDPDNFYQLKTKLAQEKSTERRSAILITYAQYRMRVDQALEILKESPLMERIHTLTCMNIPIPISGHDAKAILECFSDGSRLTALGVLAVRLEDPDEVAIGAFKSKGDQKKAKKELQRFAALKAQPQALGGAMPGGMSMPTSFPQSGVMIPPTGPSIPPAGFSMPPYGFPQGFNAAFSAYPPPTGNQGNPFMPPGPGFKP